MALSPVIRKLLHKRVVLASASPRRREILSNAGLQFEVVPSKFKETLDKALFPSPYAYAMETAKQKALEVASRMHQKDLRTPDVVIGADTVVAVGELVLEKPVDKQDAYNMLSRLSGKEHSVFTGVAIVHCSSADQVLETQVLEFYEETRVKFSELSEELLWEYIHSGEPMDKAGGYGIQALGGMLVEYVRGDFLNVVGFPLNRFCKKLAELYCLPRAQDVRRATHDSIPPVDSFESRGDLAGGCAERAPRDAGPGAGEEARGPHSQGSPRGPLEAGADPPARDCKEADCIGALEALPPCPAGLLDLIDGFKASKALFTACKLRLFDFLKGREPQTAEAVAREVGASLCGTRRLLDVCAALRLLEKTRQGYRSTALADLYLASGGEWSLHGFIEYSDGHAWDLFAQLEQAVRGDPRRSRRAAEDKDCCYPGKHTTLQTLNATHGLCRLTARHLASTFDLSRFSSACHLGGCTDALAWELARQCPWLTVTVFDLPEVIKQVSSFQPPGGQAARVHFVPGDAFRDGLPAAELFVLPRVPQAWPEDRVQQLLRRAAAACAPGGGLLLVEAALDEERAASQGGLRQRLDLLLQPEGGTRSLGECRRLLEQHSFGDLQVAPAGLVPGAVLGTRVSR